MGEYFLGEGEVRSEDYFEGLNESEFNYLVAQIKDDNQLVVYYNLIKEKLQKEIFDRGEGRTGVSRTKVVGELILALKAGGGTKGVVSEELYQRVQAMISMIKESRTSTN